jgi:hypothetical protein
MIPQVQVSASNNLGLVPGSASSAASMEPAAEAHSASAKYSYPSKSLIMQKALDKHNTYRARHGAAGPLNWYVRAVNDITCPFLCDAESSCTKCVIWQVQLLAGPLQLAIHGAPQMSAYGSLTS